MSPPLLYRISRCSVETELRGPGGSRGPGRGYCTSPGQGEAMGLGLCSSRESESNGKNSPMQTDTFNSSNWGSAEYIPVTPFHGFLTVYLFQGPTNREWFFLSFHRVVLAGAFVPHPSMCCCSQKCRFLTLSWPTASSAEKEFSLFSDTLR